MYYLYIRDIRPIYYIYDYIYIESCVLIVNTGTYNTYTSMNLS